MTDVDTVPAENDHHVRYTNANGYDGTVLIEWGTDRRGQALRQAASIRDSGGVVHEIVEVTQQGLLTVDEPATAAPLDLTVRDSTIFRRVRLTQGHIDRGRLPVPPAIREQLAPGETIVVTLYLNPGLRDAGVWSTEQLRAVLTGITWPADITPGTKADVSVQWSDGRTRRVAVIVEAPEPVPVRRRRTRAAKPRVSTR